QARPPARLRRPPLRDPLRVPLALPPARLPALGGGLPADPALDRSGRLRADRPRPPRAAPRHQGPPGDRKSTRLNSSHVKTSHVLTHTPSLHDALPISQARPPARLRRPPLRDPLRVPLALPPARLPALGGGLPADPALDRSGRLRADRPRPPRAAPRHQGPP